MEIPAYLSSFGGRKGRKLRAQRQTLMDSLLPALTLTLSKDGKLSPDSLWTIPKQTLWVELGFGGGEHLAAQGERHPEIGFIGCEPFTEGVSKLLVDIQQKQLTNIRLFLGDGRLVLEALPPHSVDRIFILFPDPWPKARHHKRRLINPPTLDLLARALKPGGCLRIATDHADYATWILEYLLADNRFAWEARRAVDWDGPPADWVPTRYEAKAKREGRAPLYFDFLRMR